MPRGWVWLQLLIGWLPVWGLFMTLLLTAHPDVRPVGASLIALRMIVAAAALGLVVRRLTERFPWPHPFRPRFVAVHLVAAASYSVAWVLLNSVIESVLRRHALLVVGNGIGAFLVLGVWLYVMVAGVSYAIRATERAARAEAAAAHAQLAALRAQLNPHFLFNALHAVVQLIPREPRQAARAAEQLAGLLRTTIEEDRDLVSLAEEWSFVERYLALERIRFGDRLQVKVELSSGADQALIPSFALQTLVENAVRHGAAPRVEPTEIAVLSRIEGNRLTVTVRDTGAGTPPDQLGNGAGTGLQRLRDRLTVLYGDRARLELLDWGGRRLHGRAHHPAMNVTTLIVDDEPVARAGLRDMLAGVSWIACVGEAASGPAAVAAINTLKPELVFLDIQMPGLLGTEVLRRVAHQPFVVFTTAFAQHAVTGFELGALDYLLKPFGPDRLTATLDRVKTALGEPAASPAFDRLREALSKGPMSRLFVRSGGAIIPVAVESVSWFEARGDYVAVHVGSARHLLHLSLNRLEARLDPARFVRIHRTHIVNLDRVSAFRREGKGRMVAELAGGVRLPVSRNRAHDLRALGA